MSALSVSLSLSQKYINGPKQPFKKRMSFFLSHESISKYQNRHHIRPCLFSLFLSYKSISKSKTAIEATHVSLGQKGSNTAFKNSASLKISPLLRLGKADIELKHGSNPYMSGRSSLLFPSNRGIIRIWIEKKKGSVNVCSLPFLAS